MQERNVTVVQWGLMRNIPWWFVNLHSLLVWWHPFGVTFWQQNTNYARTFLFWRHKACALVHHDHFGHVCLMGSNFFRIYGKIIKLETRRFNIRTKKHCQFFHSITCWIWLFKGNQVYRYRLTCIRSLALSRGQTIENICWRFDAVPLV